MNAPGQTITEDFDGCSRECRKAGKHTLKYSGCEHAPPPEPRLSVLRNVIAPDGFPSIVTDTFTVNELAARIEAALRTVPDGEYTSMAVAAAKALIEDPDAEEETPNE